MIKIDSEKRKEYKIQPPPQHTVFEYGRGNIADYMQKKGVLLQEKYRKKSEEERVESRVQEELDFYIHEEACEKMFHHCREMALTEKEVVQAIALTKAQMVLKLWDTMCLSFKMVFMENGLPFLMKTIPSAMAFILLIKSDPKSQIINTPTPSF